jgi:two-component system NtrC family sensor kinase
MNGSAAADRDPGHTPRAGPRGAVVWHHVRRCLGWRLVFVLAGALVLLLGARDLLSMRMQRQQLERQLEDRAVDIGETVLSSTRAAMLANDWARLEEDLENVARLERVVAVRLIGTDGMVDVSTRDEELGELYAEDGFACEPCHTDAGGRRPEMVVRDGLHLYGRDVGDATLGLAMPIQNEASCSSAACHAHDPSQAVLGVLDVELSTRSIEEALAAQRTRLLGLDFLTLLLVCTVVGVLAWRVVHVPLQEFVAGTRRIGSGDLDHRLRENRIGELGDLAVSFNQMAVQLRRARQELEEFNQRLEDRVAQKSKELEQARDHMVFTEKMVSLGRLAAVVAHEINNPLAGILVSVRVLRRKLPRYCPDEKARTEIDDSLAMVQRETARCGDIVRNLLFFSRQREPSLAREDLREIVARALRLVDHQAELNGVTLSLDAPEDLAEVDCDANQIQQACLAAILNAIDAMPDGGELRVSIRECNGDETCIEIQDTGCGIAPELKLKVFEPFFSTKPEGEGTGLGLSVLYGIVQRHGGRVELDSQEGSGATVRIRLPRTPDPVAFSHPEAGT